MSTAVRLFASAQMTRFLHSGSCENWHIARSGDLNPFSLIPKSTPESAIARTRAVAYVVDLEVATARVVVSQDDVAVVRERTDAAWVRLAHDLSQVLPARVVRQVPAATDRLPTRALGTSAGGPFAVDPMDPDGLRTLERVFQFDLELPPGRVRAAGERVYVRFDHGAEPIGQRGYRALRRLFLRQLGV